MSEPIMRVHAGDRVTIGDKEVVGFEGDAAVVALREARERLERRFKPYTHIGDSAYSPTDEEYVVLTSGNWYPLATTAIEAWEREIDEYAKSKSGTLYWRVVPELNRDHRMMTWHVYSRLLISDKPAIGRRPRIGGNP